jgi:hypothetical protein
MVSMPTTQLGPTSLFPARIVTNVAEVGKGDHTSFPSIRSKLTATERESPGHHGTSRAIEESAGQPNKTVRRIEETKTDRTSSAETSGDVWHQTKQPRAIGTYRVYARLNGADLTKYHAGVKVGCINIEFDGKLVRQDVPLLSSLSLSRLVRNYHVSSEAHNNS